MSDSSIVNENLEVSSEPHRPQPLQVTAADIPKPSPEALRLLKSLGKQ